MKLSISIAIAAASCALIAPIRAHAGQSVGNDPIENRAAKAGSVVVGTVLDTQAKRFVNRHGDQLIVTEADLSVEETLKGKPVKHLKLRVEGGTLDGLTLTVSDMPSIQPGERGVFFLGSDADGMPVPSGRGHGILKLENGTDHVGHSSLTLETIRERVKAGAERGAK